MEEMTFWYWLRYDGSEVRTWCREEGDDGSPLLAVNCQGGGGTATKTKTQDDLLRTCQRVQHTGRGLPREKSSRGRGGVRRDAALTSTATISDI
jgi:hypothetical protein